MVVLRGVYLSVTFFLSFHFRYVDAFTCPGRASCKTDSHKIFSTLIEESETAAAAPVAVTLEQTEDDDTDTIRNLNRGFPGLEENDKFECDESVEFWRDFQKDGVATAQENIQSLGRVATSFASLGPEGMSYWLRHVGRSSYFATNAVLGNLGYILHERLVNQNPSSKFGDALPVQLDGTIASRLLLEAALCFDQDYRQIQKGSYREPWDMKNLNHRQSSPINIATQTGRFLQEAIGTLGRRSRGEQRDKEIWISDESSPDLYPDYYRTAFHYQTDGWMSKRSADVYETSTETLFLGRQDAMQRTSLRPLIEAVNHSRMTTSSPGKVLEIACGTGRFMTFVRDNLPLDTEYTAIDLSPFYLDAARDNDQYWRKTRKSEEERKGLKWDALPARLVQGKAESLPFDDESFDAVLCVFLFHELPGEVRERAVAEMARVLRPGGTVVLTDSIQLGDRPALDDRMSNFGNFNEPYYLSYLEDSLPTHFELSGLIPKTKSVRSSTKSLSFTKPN